MATDREQAVMRLNLETMLKDVGEKKKRNADPDRKRQKRAPAPVGKGR